MQMGWLDRLDVRRFGDMAHEIWGDDFMVVHGVSMGAGAVMMASGEMDLPKQVKGIIDVELAIPAQMHDDIALEVLGRAPIYEYCRSGGLLFDDEGIYAAVKKIIDGGAK